MIRRFVILAACLLSVSAGEPAPLCQPASAYGAIGGGDNRIAFQKALDAGCLDLRGTSDRYSVAIPPYPRPYATLTMPAGSQIIGDGRATISFTGSPGKHDWYGVRPLGRWRIAGLTLSVDEPGGEWDEQSHVIAVIGPVIGGELSDVTINHPSVPGSKRGDCVRILGRNTSRVWDQHIHHVLFKACARTSVSIYGGLHGSQLPPDAAGDVHSTSRIDHTTNLDTRGQDIDMEGSGDTNGGIDATDVVEIDHNVYLQGPHAASALAVSIYPGATHLHHNTITGRGVDFLGGNHETDHNTYTMTTPNGGDPMFYFRKVGTLMMHDETLIRSLSAGPGPVFTAAQKITAPTSVVMNDVTIWQHTAAGSIVISGVGAFRMRGVHVNDDGPPSPTFRDAVRIEGTNSLRTGSVVVAESDLTGPVRVAISVTGSYKGVGSIEVTNTTSMGATYGLRCENVASTATFGGITGPIVYENNVMPTPLCSVP